MPHRCMSALVNVFIMQTFSLDIFIALSHPGPYCSDYMFSILMHAARKELEQLIIPNQRQAQQLPSLKPRQISVVGQVHA